MSYYTEPPASYYAAIEAEQAGLPAEAPDYDTRWEEGAEAPNPGAYPGAADEDLVGFDELDDAPRDELDGECARCGELTSINDRAEVAEGLVHAQCMRPGEEIA